jgi:hypothetical protein
MVWRLRMKKKTTCEDSWKIQLFSIYALAVIWSSQNINRSISLLSLVPRKQAFASCPPPPPHRQDSYVNFMLKLAIRYCTFFPPCPRPLILLFIWLWMKFWYLLLVQKVEDPFLNTFSFCPVCMIGHKKTFLFRSRSRSLSLSPRKQHTKLFSALCYN